MVNLNLVTMYKVFEENKKALDMVSDLMIKYQNGSGSEQIDK